MGELKPFSRAHPSREFEAQYGFRCGCCDEWYKEGTPARYIQNGVMVASACPNLEDAGETIFSTVDVEEVQVISEAERKRALERMCPGCFLELPASGVCGTC